MFFFMVVVVVNFSNFFWFVICSVVVFLHNHYYQGNWFNQEKREILVYCDKFYSDFLTGNIFCWNKPCGKHWKCFCLCCFGLFQLHTGQYGNECCIDAGGSCVSAIILPVAGYSIYTHTLQKHLHAALSCGWRVWDHLMNLKFTCTSCKLGHFSPLISVTKMAQFTWILHITTVRLPAFAVLLCVCLHTIHGQ